MWHYSQSTGLITQGVVAHGTGYAGKGDGKNNPELQHLHDVGPLPQGRYVIGEPQDTESHGPFVLRLEPHEDNDMFGRAGFLIHGDSIDDPGNASNGCIILPRAVREHIAASGDTDLLVIE